MPKSSPKSPKGAVNRPKDAEPGAISMLSPGILLDVFAQVHSVQGLAICSLVCRLWHALVRSSICQYGAFRPAAPETDPSGLLWLPALLFTQTWTYALEMDLSSFQNGTNQVLPVTDTKLVYLSALSPSIRQLNLRYVR